jgi:hypothetical protein
MVEHVYKTMWAAHVSDQSGGKSVSEATGDAMEQVEAQLEQMQASEDLTPEQRQQLAQSQEQFRAQARQTQESARQMDVPPENIALFEKHEREIRKYTMHGLELVSML